MAALQALDRKYGMIYYMFLIAALISLASWA